MVTIGVVWHSLENWDIIATVIALSQSISVIKDGHMVRCRDREAVKFVLLLQLPVPKQCVFVAIPFINLAASPSPSAQYSEVNPNAHFVLRKSFPHSNSMPCGEPYCSPGLVDVALCFRIPAKL